MTASMRVSWTPPAQPSPSARSGAVLHRLAGETMGTTWSVALAGPVHWLIAPLRQAAQRALDEVVEQMSNWKADSAIGRFNAAPSGSWHALPAETVFVVEAALALARATDGACDPTIGPLVDLWGFGPSRRRASVPSQDEIDASRARAGWRRVERDAEGRFLQPGGLGLDLCGIAKGFGVDRVMAALTAAGVTDCLVEVGGELRARGRRPDGQPWRVAVEGPSASANRGAASAPMTGEPRRSAARPARESQAAVLELNDMAVATSGDRWHFFEHDGRRLSHTLDPRTGRPVMHDLASVTVLHRECMQADALATALTVLGPAAGMDHALLHGLAVMMARRSADGAVEVQMSPAFEATLHGMASTPATANGRAGESRALVPPTATHRLAMPTRSDD